MKKYVSFVVFIVDHFDAILAAVCMPFFIASLMLNLKNSADKKKRHGAPKDEIKELIQQEISNPQREEQYSKKCSSLLLCIPFIISNLIILFGVTNLYILLPYLFFLLILEIVYIVKNLIPAFMLLSYTDASPLFCNIFMQSLLLIPCIILPTFLAKTPFDFSSKLLPAACWIGGGHGVYAFVHMLSGGKRDALVKLQPCSLLLLTFTESLTIITSWAVGSYYFISFFGYYNMDWAEWIRTILLYRGNPFITCVRWGGIGLLLMIIIGQCYLTVKVLKPHIFRKLIPVGIPSLALLFGIICAGLHISQEPNYLYKLSLPLTVNWKCAEVNSHLIQSELDNQLAVFANGTALYTDINTGVLIDYCIEVIEDFSNQPYLRFYSKTLYDGCVSIWVENQGGICAENCEFKLIDSGGYLKKHFAKEALLTNIQTLPPGTHQCLFTLENKDMVVPEYSEIPLFLVIESKFRNGLQSWKLSKTIPGEAMLSMRGVTITNAHSQETIGQLVTPGNALHLIEEVNYSGNRQFFPRIYCDQTAILQVSISVITPSRQVLKQEPMIFIYESQC